MDPIQISSEENDEVVISRDELETVMKFAATYAEQNAVVLDGLKTLRDEMIAQAENLTATFASLVDAISNIQVVVNLPEQPPPVVNVPEITVQPADVKVNMPKPKREVQTIKRNRDGLIESTETKIEY
jgi:hypothetical protein